jgi:hypothetical protein
MKGVLRGNAAAIAVDGGAIGALVLVNVAARLIVRLTGSDSDTQFVIGLWSLGAMVVVAAVAAFVWARRNLMARVVADGLIVVVTTSLLVTLFGPFVSGNSPFLDAPFGDAFADFLLQLSVCLAVLGIGAMIGVLVTMALGLDPKSRAWKAQSERIKATARQRQRRTTRR